MLLYINLTILKIATKSLVFSVLFLFAVVIVVALFVSGDKLMSIVYLRAQERERGLLNT